MRRSQRSSNKGFCTRTRTPEGALSLRFDSTLGRCVSGLLVLGALLGATGCSGRGDAAAAYHAGEYARTYQLTRAAAEQGDSAAQNTLGVLYYAGIGVVRDYPQAMHWFELAALQGDPHARRHLASMFRQGLGTPKDDFRAFGWYDAARQSGHPGALDYMRWMALVVGTNQQALGRRIVAQDLKNRTVSHGTEKAAGS